MSELYYGAFGCLLIILSFGEHVSVSTENLPVAQTGYGPIQGLKFTSNWTNQSVYAFKGIPYAAPPVGPLRFQDPVAPKIWTTTKDCTKHQSWCPQIPIFSPPKSENITEDCLYLNVYTPEIQTGQPLLPVMVWIHGGAFVEGSGDYDQYGPDLLVAEGVVVVTLNYRLGAFGFLSLGTPDVPGNAGLKDQAFALKWVQQEIIHFGGDAGSVTLFGVSAGSASVHLHYLSTFSKGLFHRVIGESGAALASWAVRENDDAARYGLELLKFTNCSSTDFQIAQKCLKEIDVTVLLKAQFMVQQTPEDKVAGNLVFTPSVDKKSSEPFLTDLPKNLLLEKKGSFVPFIMGINSDEGLLAVGGKKEEEISNITNNIEDLIPSNVKSASTKSRIEFLSKRIREFYFKDTIPSFSNLRGYVDIYTDKLFAYPTRQCAKSYQQRAHSYLYLFSFNGSFKQSFSKMLNFSGVMHGEEVGYLFVRDDVNQTAADDSNEMKTWRRMVRMWTNFAKFGSPTPENDPLLQNVTWLPVGNVSTKYLSIDVNLTMEKTDFLDSRMKLWDSITTSSSSYLEATVAVVGISALVYNINYFYTSK